MKEKIFFERITLVKVQKLLNFVCFKNNAILNRCISKCASLAYGSTYYADTKSTFQNIFFQQEVMATDIKFYTIR